MESGHEMHEKHDPRFCSESGPNGEASHVVAFEDEHSVDIASWALHSCKCTSSVVLKKYPVCKEG